MDIAGRGCGLRHDAVDPAGRGRQSARRIIAISKARIADLTESDYAHMRKVVGYVKRHGAQRPAGDVSRTRWRYALMNWGHDPMKRDVL